VSHATLELRWRAQNATGLQTQRQHCGHLAFIFNDLLYRPRAEAFNSHHALRFLLIQLLCFGFLMRPNARITRRAVNTLEAMLARTAALISTLLTRFVCLGLSLPLKLIEPGARAIIKRKFSKFTCGEKSSFAWLPERMFDS
jgi:hypothetical protein